MASTLESFRKLRGKLDAGLYNSLAHVAQTGTAGIFN